MASSWLTWQCQMVSGVIRGAVYSPQQIKHGGSLALWPSAGRAEAQLVAAANQALKKNRVIQFSKITYGTKKQRLCDVIACPIVKDGQVSAIVSIAFSVRSEPQQQAVLQLVLWGGQWLDTLFEKHQQNTEQLHEYAITLSEFVAKQPSAQTAAIEAVNRLAKGAACDRVSLGVRSGLTTRLKAISNTPDFDRASPLVRRIETAMEESCDQKAVIAYPPEPQSILIDHAHAELAKRDGHRFLLSIPLYSAGVPIAALTFERSGEIPFDHATVQFLKSITTLLSSTFTHKIQLEKPLLAQFSSKCSAVISSLLGKKYFALKMLCVAALAFVVLSKIVTASYTIGAPSRIEGSVRQLIAAPVDGYIKTANVRAGDKVVSGQTLAVLDSSKLQLQRQKHEAEKRQVAQEFHDALALQDRTKIAKLDAKIAQINSEIELVDILLKRSTLSAPFDGVVVSGDLSQALGAPVEVGKVLFEVAPLESYRVILEVPERNISFLEKGQTGKLVVTALPDTVFKLTVDNISPMANSNASGNFFKVEAILNEHSNLLLPGMRGITKIDSIEKDLWWIWTHRLLDKISLFFWSLGL